MTGPTRPLEDRDYQALARFRHSLRRFLNFSEQAARAEGLTTAQHQLLLAIRGHRGPNPPSATDLAEALQRRRHSTVELVARAEQHGLVTTHADPEDHRRRLVRLTIDGDAVLERLTELHRHELRDFGRDFTATLRELDG